MIYVNNNNVTKLKTCNFSTNQKGGVAIKLGKLTIGMVQFWSILI